MNLKLVLYICCFRIQYYFVAGLMYEPMIYNLGFLIEFYYSRKHISLGLL